MVRTIILFLSLTAFAIAQQTILYDNFEDGDLNNPTWYAKFGVPPGSFEVVNDPLDGNNRVLKAIGASYTAHAGLFSQWSMADAQNFSTHDNSWSYKFMIPSNGASGEFSIAFYIVLDNTVNPNNTCSFSIIDKGGFKELRGSFILSNYYEGTLETGLNIPRDVWLQFNVDHSAGTAFFHYELQRMDDNTVLLSDSTDFFGAPVNQMPAFSEFGLGAEVQTAQYFDDVLVTGQEAPTTPTACALDSGLVAYYPFNGNAEDESGNGFDGTNNGTTADVDRFGTSSASYLFGGGDYVNAGNIDLGGLNHFTVNAWIKLDQADGMIVASDNAPSDRTFYLYAHPGEFIETLIVSDGSAYLMASQTQIVPDNTWRQITLVRDGGTAKLYIDGVMENSQLISGTTNSSTPLLIGKRQYSGLPLPFNGNIDDVRIYDRALSASEVENLYLNNGCPNDPPVAIAQGLQLSSGDTCMVFVGADAFDNGSYDPEGGTLTFAVEPAGPYPLGTTDISLIATDDGGLSDTAFASITVTGGSAQVAGTVQSGGSPLQSVIVKLLDNSDPTIIIADTTTDAAGNYAIKVSPGTYQVMVVEPLGYTSNQNFVYSDLPCGADEITNFDFTQNIVENDARGKGYWKHQFDVYVKGRGKAKETEAELQSYIDNVEAKYEPHFELFADTKTFEEWQAVLSVKGNAGMAAKAKSHVATLVLNIMSEKLAQYEVVTDDGYTAGDVLTYTSELLTDSDGSNDETAKDLAEQVNEQQMIASGQVHPSQMIQYSQVRSDLALSLEYVPTRYELFQNYPNPFNPTTSISFALPKDGKTRVEVYNTLGERVAVLVDGEFAKGVHTVSWNATGQSSGLYFYRISSGAYTAIKKMILVK